MSLLVHIVARMTGKDPGRETAATETVFIEAQRRWSRIIRQRKFEGRLSEISESTEEAPSTFALGGEASKT
jgi:hypothetical protein